MFYNLLETPYRTTFAKFTLPVSPILVTRIKSFPFKSESNTALVLCLHQKGFATEFLCDFTGTVILECFYFLFFPLLVIL